MGLLMVIPVALGVLMAVGLLMEVGALVAEGVLVAVGGCRSGGCTGDGWLY